MWKNRVFLLAVLYWTVDGTARDAGRDSSGRWTGQLGTLDGPSCTGQTQPGAAGQWTLDKWTVDGTEWTEPSVQLFTTPSISYCFEVDRRDKKFINKIYRLQRLCPALSRIWSKINGLREQVDRAPENTHIYLYNIFIYFPLLLTPLYYIYIFFTVQIK